MSRSLPFFKNSSGGFLTAWLQRLFCPVGVLSPQGLTAPSIKTVLTSWLCSCRDPQYVLSPLCKCYLLSAELAAGFAFVCQSTAQLQIGFSLWLTPG